MRGLPNPGSMSETAPILIQLKQWQEKKWVNMTEFKSVTITRRKEFYTYMHRNTKQQK